MPKQDKFACRCTNCGRRSAPHIDWLECTVCGRECCTACTVFGTQNKSEEGKGVCINCGNS